MLALHLTLFPNFRDGNLPVILSAFCAARFCATFMQRAAPTCDHALIASHFREILCMIRFPDFCLCRTQIIENQTHDASWSFFQIYNSNLNMIHFRQETSVSRPAISRHDRLNRHEVNRELANKLSRLTFLTSK